MCRDFFKMKGYKDGLKHQKGKKQGVVTQQTHTKLHNTFPISSSNALPMNQWNKHIGMVLCSFVYVCC